MSFVSRVILVTAMFWSICWCAGAARAELRIPQPVADAGDVRSGPQLSHRFSLVNDGPDLVTVTAVQTSCGCLTPRLDRHTLAPGEQGSLLLEVNTLSQPAGPNSWSVHVRCRHGSTEQELTLLLKAQLITEVTVQPAAMTVFVEQALAHEVTVTDLRAKPFTVTRVQSSSPHLAASITQQARDGQGHWIGKVNLELSASFPEGHHAETISIYTDDPAYAELKVPVTIVKRARQRLSALPAQVTLLAAHGQPVPSRIVLIRDANDQAVVVDHITADDPAVVCQWAQGPNNLATVKITVDRTRVPGEHLRSAVHVQLSQPLSETVTIPVTCTLP